MGIVLDLILGEKLVCEFTTRSLDGIATDADSLPVVDIYCEDNLTPVLTLPAVHRRLGQYYVSFVLSETVFQELNVCYSIIVSASVNGVFDREVIGSFVLREAHVGQLTSVSSEINTLKNRIGNFLGSGVENIYGYLRAIFSKTAQKPNISGFDPNRDSLEAIGMKTETVSITQGILGSLTPGVFRQAFTVTKLGEPLVFTRGDYIEAGKVSFKFGSGYGSMVNRKMFFCVKRDKRSEVLLDIECVITNPYEVIGYVGDLDFSEFQAGRYLYEFERVEMDGSKPLTPIRGELILQQDIRDRR